MKVNCPRCPAEMDVGRDCDDVSDTRYKLLCPEIRDRLAAEGGTAFEFDCINMRTARDSAIRKSPLEPLNAVASAFPVLG
jgi:hypothetical protein